VTKPKTLATFFDEYVDVTIDVKFVYEATRWCENNVGPINLNWHYYINANKTTTFKFKNKDVALMFLLKFGN